MPDKSHRPTGPGTQISWSALRPWCAGHHWASRRGLGWVHRLGHRARVLRVKGLDRPLVYLDTKAPGGDFPCCAPPEDGQLTADEWRRGLTRLHRPPPDT